MSQLLTRFLASVHEFNYCKNAADYLNLIVYYHPNATLYEVDPPYRPHGAMDPTKPAGVAGNRAIVDYLANSQPALWPRFWPSLPISETANSDNLTVASLDGSATYSDCTNPNRPQGAITTPYTIKFHFEFTRKDTLSPWLVTFGNGYRVP
jgi:hypothetical protein